MSFLRYSTLVLLVAAATLAAVGLVVPAEAKARAAILFGALLAILNTLVAHALASWPESPIARARLAGGARAGMRSSRLRGTLGVPV
ncbi:MAG: hypothetical protein ACHQRO_14755, partial [Vicinamibacteria bacterium]